MTDNTDLLGGFAPTAETTPAPAPKKRGRPSNAERAASLKAQLAEAKAPTIETPKFDELQVAPLTEGVLSQAAVSAYTVGAGLLNARDVAFGVAASELVPASTTTAGVDPAAPGADETITSEQNTDGSTSVVLPPVSPEYAAAQANRIRAIGRAPKEYAWQRLKRAGKRI